MTRATVIDVMLEGGQETCMADLNPEAAWHLIQNLILIKMLFSLPACLIRVTYPLTQLLQNSTGGIKKCNTMLTLPLLQA